MSPSEPTRFWPVGPDRVLSLDPFVVMGVVNMTPDSFSDGGQFATVDEALAHALQLVDEGAGIIDVGGESTRRPTSRFAASFR
jgi:dihydropteroate synthase